MMKMSKELEKCVKARDGGVYPSSPRARLGCQLKIKKKTTKATEAGGEVEREAGELV